MRRLSYGDALREALTQEMARDESVFVYGIGVPTHAKVFGTVAGLDERFPGRVIDTPICESALTGFGLGAALGGLRPVHVHIRVDFLAIALGQLLNMVSTMRYATGQAVPLTIRAIVGRGWGQGWQHSKSLHSVFAHIPGLKVVAPTTPSDAKGALAAAIRDDNPVLVLEHRWLYFAEDDVPEKPYVGPLGPGAPARRRAGNDLTIVATSWMVVEALHAADILARVGVGVEVIDPRVLAPLDTTLICRSAADTGRLIVADNDWTFCGLGAEIVATVAEHVPRVQIRRIGWAHTPCPTVRCLENEFYPNAATIVRAAEELLVLDPIDLSQEDFYSHERRFRGPF